MSGTAYNPFLSSGTGITGAANIGPGIGIAEGVSSGTLLLRSLAAGSGVTVTQEPDDVLISSSGMQAVTSITFVGSSGANIVTMPNNTSDALDFKDVAHNSYMNFDTTTGRGQVNFGVGVNSATAIGAPTVNATTQLITPYVDTGGSALAVGTVNATSVTLGTSGNTTVLASGTTTSTGVLKQTGTVTQQNVNNGTMTTNTTTTSASATLPLCVGGTKEVFWDTCDVNGNVSANLSSNKSLSINSTTGTLAVQQDSAANGDHITLTSPANLAVGQYALYYNIIMDNLRPIVDIALQINGGGFQNLRTGVDLYTAGAGTYCSNMMEFFTVTTGGSPMLVKFTANGKNAASSNYFIQIGNFRLLKTG